MQERTKPLERLALANDQSAYDEAYLREDLMDFIEALLKLVEAFWLIRQRNIYKDKPKYALPWISKFTTRIMRRLQSQRK